MKKFIKIEVVTDKRRYMARIPLGWVLLVAMTFGLIVFAGPIATHLSGALHAHSQAEAMEQFRARPDYPLQMKALEAAGKKLERQRARERMQERKRADMDELKRKRGVVK